MSIRYLIIGLLVGCCASLAAYAQEGEVTIPSVREGGLFEVETLPYQALTINRPIQMIVPRADGGATAIFLYWRQNPSEAILLNMDTGEERRDENRNYARPRSQIWGADGKLYFGMWSSTTVFRYNPVEDTIEHLGECDPEGNNLPIFTLGTDNKVYGMAGNQGRVFSIDPETDEIILYGQQGPDRFGGNYTGTLGVDDDYIYSTFGNMAQEIHTVAMNKETREWVALEEIRGATIRQGDVGVTATHDGNTYWLYEGKAILREDPDEAPPWQGKEPLARISPPEFEGRPEILGDQNTTANVNLDGSLSFYYRTSPDQEWKETRHELEPNRLTFSRIAALPDGKLFLSTIGYEGFYLFDPAEDKFERLGLASASHYCSVVHDNKVYMGSYPRGSSLFMWDPEKDWTAGRATPENPRVIPVTSQNSNPRLLGMWPSPPRGFQHRAFWSWAPTTPSTPPFMAKDTTSAGCSHGMNWIPAI